VRNFVGVGENKPSGLVL